MTIPVFRPAPATPQKGERTFELDLHLTFARPLPREEALALLRALPLTAELYAPYTDPGTVPSARLTGGPVPAADLQAALQAWLAGPVRTAEVGLRGLLRSAEGQLEWMPWRRNVLLSRHDLGGLRLREGEKYILE